MNSRRADRRQWNAPHIESRDWTAALFIVLMALPPSATAFDFDAATMRGKVSYVRLQLDEATQKQIVSSTAKTPDPATFRSPNYGTTQMCRTELENKDSEPPHCRTYAIYIPSTYDGQKPMPVHLSLHGNGGFAEAQIGNIPRNDPDIENDTEFALSNSGLEGRYNDLAERHGFIAVYPNGRINGGGTVVNGRNWNDCRKLNPVLRNGNPNTTYSDADDVGFINALLDDVMGALSVDPQRVYAHGYSNGAMMVMRLYQELGHRFTAFATTAGNMPVREAINLECDLAFDAPKKPILLNFGDLDYVVPYYGGCIVDGAQVPLASMPSLYCQRGNMMSADQTIAFFTQHLGAEAPGVADMAWPLNWQMVRERNYSDGVPLAPDATRPAPDPADDGGYAIYGARVYGAGNSTSYFRSYQVPGSSLEVRVKKTQNGGHTQSGLNPVTEEATAALLGPKNLDSQLADELFTFFDQYRSLCGAREVALGPIYDQTTTRPTEFAWQQFAGINGYIQDDEICFPSRQSGATLRATLFAPRNFSQQPDGSLPVVIIGPGSGNGLALYYLWSARELAAQGYVALVFDPQGLGRSETVGDCGAGGCPGVPFQSADNFVDGFLSALDFVKTGRHPWLVKADLARIGLAGHSLSARSATFVGNSDPRVSAVVGWDNMASDLHGDRGSSAGEGVCANLIGGELPGTSTPIMPRVPTMGQAADANGTCNVEENTANNLGNLQDLKKSGYQKWVEAGIPAALLAFHGAVHGDWAQSNRAGVEQQLEVFQYYTRAWFDLFLKDDEAARAKLVASTLKLSATELDIGNNAANKNGSLSRKFRSAVFMPDVLEGCLGLIKADASVEKSEATPCVLPDLPPSISKLFPLLMKEDAVEQIVRFQISDAATPADQLDVTVASDNLALFPPGSLSVEGAGRERVLRLMPALDLFGAAAVTLTVSDGVRNFSRVLPVTVTPVNDAPVITPIPALTVGDGLPFSYQVLATDVDVPTDLDYSLLQAPQGMTISDAGLVQWAVPAGAALNVPVRVQVSDGELPVEQGFTLEVRLLDTDVDGLPDSFERDFGLDPNSAADAVQDSDGDGVSNLDEFRAGTDPRRNESDNQRPTLDLRVMQGGQPRSLVFRNQGLLTFIADAVDPEDDALSHDWGASDAVLMPPVMNVDRYTLDPQTLSPGVHALRTTVTDALGGRSSADRLFVVLDSASVLTEADSDGDGTSDIAEGFADSDGDGISDYLDSSPDAERLQSAPGESPLQTQAGFSLHVGKVALRAARGGARITAQDLASAMNNAANVVDSAVNVGGLYDFEIRGVAVGGSAQVVIPLGAAIPPGAVYRKYHAVGGWRDFVTGAADALASAAAVAGVCLPPGSAVYQAGLNLGHDCVRLSLSDGGPNDSDGIADGVIRDPGGVGLMPAPPAAPVVLAPRGGALNASMMLLLLAVVLCRTRVPALRPRGALWRLDKNQ